MHRLLVFGHKNLIVSEYCSANVYLWRYVPRLRRKDLIHALLGVNGMFRDQFRRNFIKLFEPLQIVRVF